MNHLPFIIASYAASVIVLGGVAIWILATRARVRRDLAALEAQGVKRRSES